jgi:hypothetical protein
LEGREEKKCQYDDGDGPSGIPRKAHGFIIPEKDEGEFVMFQPVPLFEFLMGGIGHRDPIIPSYQPPRVLLTRLLIFYEETPACGQAPYTIGLLPRNHPLCFGEKTGLSEGHEKE